MDQFLIGLLAHLAVLGGQSAVTPHPKTSQYGYTIGCVSMTKGETRYRGWHSMTCYNAISGEVLGAMLKPSGRVACSITGYYDGYCLTLEVCGRRDTVC